MKLSPRTVTLLWDVHTWVGILTALVLATMFFAGSLSVFHHELEAWQDPPTARGDIAQLDAAVARLDPATLAGKSFGAAPPSGHAARAVLYPEGAPPVVIDPATGAASAPSSIIGQLFFHLHFMWHEAFPTGMIIAGLFGVLLLLALVTGLVIHLKDLRRQAFRFRPALRPRYAWSDLHKVLGVWGLPFQVMIAFTGAVICLAPILIPPIASAAFDGDRARGQRELYASGPAPTAKPSDEPAPTLSFVELAGRAERALPGMEVTYVWIERWGRKDARATVYGDLRGAGGFSPGVNLVLDASDGTVVSRSTDAATPSSRTMSVVYGIHFASYGGFGLRLLYVLLGLGGWLTILSGNWIWIERRAGKRRSVGNQVLGRLTLGIGGGIVLAAVAILWANRLAAPTPARLDLEIWTFFGTWAAAALVALAVPATRRSWAVLLGLAGAGFALIPLLSILWSPAHLGNGGGFAGWKAAGFDLAFGLAGALFLLAARVAWRHAQPSTPSAGSAELEEVLP
ncbi:MAG TPA: PepSY-associated TM helix domain-containing protein [Kofleriaceae bacterium]|jgi:uncharacterized iron-regulated membrane protein|nr:PepSY-associated TM helix domain-containing protein [Kofleriaceae bacterium]